MEATDRDLKELVIARGSTLMDLHGIGPSGAARPLADVGDVRRFADRNRFAPSTGQRRSTQRQVIRNYATPSNAVATPTPDARATPC